MTKNHLYENQIRIEIRFFQKSDFLRKIGYEKPSFSKKLGFLAANTDLPIYHPQSKSDNF